MSEISPMKLAEKLNVRPQAIYKLIRDGKIPFVERDGKKFVEEEEATKMVQRHTGSPRGRKKGDTVKKRSGGGSYRKGSIASWPRHPKGGNRIAQVIETGETIVTLRDLQGKIVNWEEESLAKRIARKEITIETPYGLLQMLHSQWTFEGRQDLLDPLEFFMSQVEDILNPPATLSEEEESGCKGYRVETDNGSEYDCEYPYAGHITCEYCIFGEYGGELDPRINPEDEKGDDENEQED